MLRPNRRPTHPGKLLKAHYLDERRISITALAKAVDRSRKNISDVVNGRARIDAELAHRLSEVLDTTARFWMNAQIVVDLWDERQASSWKPQVHFTAVESIA